MDFQPRPLRQGIRWLSICLSLVVFGSAALAQQQPTGQIAGANVNMVSGTQWPGGDPFLQRQNEPSIAVSSRNSFHLLAGANDYRSVDLALTTNGETGDAWVGLFKSLDGGATWRSVLLPGCPYNTPICAGAPNVQSGGYQAAADPTVRPGSNGMFYYSALVFNRGINPQSAIVVSRLIDLNNKENADPSDILNGDAIQYIGTSIVAKGSSSLFLDKPTMAVDIPRPGAASCNITVNQPGNGNVRQSFAAGTVYVTYTAFEEAPGTDPTETTGPQKSKLYFVRSTNCGATWSKPVVISAGITVSQGASIAIDPNTGVFYVVWREFQYQSGRINQPDAIMVAASADSGISFSSPQAISTFTPFDEGTTNTSFRTNAYPTIAIDQSSRIYVAYAARNTIPSGDARIVLTSSTDGQTWTAPQVIDNPPIDPVTNPSGRGHQIMPTLSFAGGVLSLLYYDLRLDHTFASYTPLLLLGEPTGSYSQTADFAGELALNPPDFNAVFNTFIDDSTITLRRHTFDLRLAQALPGPAPVFSPSILVSQYAYGCCSADQTDIEQMEFNAPNLPLFKSGTAPFMGDYVDLAPGPLIVAPQAPREADYNPDSDADDWLFNISSSTPTVWHAAWTDNRDVQAPPNGDWTQYTPPMSSSLGTTSIFQPGTTIPPCQPGYTGTRNQNIYTAPISNGLIFGAPSNSKTLGTTEFNGQTVPFQRAFVLVAQNTTQQIKSFRLTVANQPTGGSASFLQFAQLTTLDLSIPPLSSATRPVFVVSTNPRASVGVNIAEITAPQGTLVPNGLTGTTILNADPTNPAITNPAITNPGITNPGITNFEVTNPAITNPAITNPAITNPAITNPGITNPGITNAGFQNENVVNPAITNPAITNPAITNPSIATPAITNPGITNVDPDNVSVSDTQWTVMNTGNTTGAYTLNLASSSTVPPENLLQLIISKTYQTPAAPTGQSCSLAVETHSQIVTNIVNPVLMNPANPGITNPGITNPAITNATVSLAPGESANIDIRVTNMDKQHEPTFNPATSVVPVAVSQSVNTQTALASGGGETAPPTPVSVPPLAISNATLPDGVVGVVYAAAVTTQGGNPTTHTFTVTAGALPPGLMLDLVAGSITGVPTTVGAFAFTIQVQDVGSVNFPQNTATQTFTINIAPAPTGPAPLTFTANSVPSGVVGRNYAQQLPVTGGTQPYMASVTAGSLPPGIAVSGAMLSGTAFGQGTFTFTVKVTDSSTPPQSASQTITLTINTLVITTTALPGGIVGVPYNATIATEGGTLPLSFSLTTAEFPPGLKIQQPAPTGSAGALVGTPILPGTYMFSESVTDSSASAQTATQRYMLTISPPGSAVPANVTFVSEPQNSVGGQVLSGGPITVQVNDVTGAPVSGVSVAMSLTGNFGTPAPCPVAVLSGTLSAVTGANGQATFSNLSIDRGQFNYALLASAGSTSQSSGPFSVQGFCASGNLLTPREGHTQDLLLTAQSTFKFPLDPKGSYLFTNPPDTSDQPLIIPLASLGIQQGAVISGQPQGDMDFCAVGSFCYGEQFQPFTCAVFSSSNTLFPPTAGLNRIPGAIAPDFTTAFSCQTPNTGVGNLPTDIPQDFAFFGEPVTVPHGAAYLFVAVADSFYSDNSDPNGDVGVEIIVNPANSVNGDVLIAGGLDNNGNVLNTAELYHPLLGFSSPTGNLTDPYGRANHVSVVLQNGQVLLAGGVNNAVGTVASAELYNPATGTFTATGSMANARYYTAAALLPDGRVLVGGGFDNNGTAETSAEIYDPNTGLFTPTGNLNQARGRHTMTLLPNGKVLVTGGRDAQGQTFNTIASAEIFDPFANQGVGAFTLIGNMNSPRSVHTARLLSNGTVLIAGGFNGGNTSLSVASAEIFDPSTNAFTPTGSMNVARARQTATLLPDGTVLEAGGINSFNGVNAPAPTELYSSVSGSFAQTGSMNFGRELATATMLPPDGNVLVTGGDDGVNELAVTELYYNTIAQTPVVITTTSLPNGVISQPYVQMLLEQNRSGPVTWSLASGSLPPGITLGSTNGFLTGTPTTVGSFSFAVSVTDGISTATASFTINVSLTTLAFTSNAMPSGGVAKSYNQPLPVTGGTLPYTVAVTGGTLPPGLALSSTGVLSGTPSSAGSFTFAVNVTDSSAPAQSATQTLTMAVDTLSIVTTVLPDGLVGVPYSSTISASGGTLPLNFSLATSAFPPGLTIQGIGDNQRSAALAGTPSTAGHYVFSETVTDSSSPVQSATQIYTMDISPAGTTGTPATVTFTEQPQNSVGGQLIPVVVHVVDANNAPVAGASVTISFNGAPPCSSAVLSGTLSAFTGGNGNAFFPDLSIDRGQLGYTLLASAGSASGVSQPFTVNGFCETGNLTIGRRFATSTLLPNGSVLATGGDTPAGGSGSASAELFDPVPGSFTASGTMINARAAHKATLLSDGEVLITGGRGPTGQTATAELYNPASGQFTSTGAMAAAREDHTSTLLLDGRVLIVGGFTGLLGTTAAYLNGAELYDPASSTFSLTGSLTTARAFHTATLLPNGKVLVAGGQNSSGPLASAEIFDPSTGTFTTTSNMSTPRQLHAAVLLPNGTVLVAGGQGAGTASLSSAELFDPTTGGFTVTGSLLSASVESNATLLPDGTALVSDGFTFPSTVAEIYSPASRSFAATGNSVNARVGNGVTLLADGRVLLAGGADPSNSGTTTILNSAEVYYSTAPLAPLAVTTPTAAPPGTTVFTDPTSFGAATSPATTTGFNGIIPAGSTFAGFNPLVLNRITFSTPLSTSGVDINVTKSTFYTPSVYSADFITASVVPATGAASANNTLVITLPAPTTAFGMDFGGLGFLGASTATITLSNGFSLPLSSLPTVGHTEFRGFVSTTPFNTITLSTVNDDFVVLDVLLASASTILPGGAVGKPYTQMLLEQGGLGALTWTLASGSLPPGITMSSAGVLSGTPTTGGTFTFTVHLVDSSTPQKSVISGNFVLTVTAGLAFPAQAPGTAITGVSYSATLTATGGAPPYSFAVTTGTLPAGISLSTSGVFSGTPSGTGSSTFTVTVTDSSSPPQTAAQTFTIVVAAPLTITTTTLPNGAVGVAYTITTIGTSGGSGTVSLAVTSGSVPTGLTLSTAGTLSGTPSVANSFTFTVRATDQSVPPQTASQSYTVTIAAVPTGVPGQIKFVSQPTNTTAGQPITPAVTVQVLDTAGFPLSGVTVTIGTGPGTNQPILSGTLWAQTDPTGTATFSNIVVDRADSGLSLVASLFSLSTSGAIQLTGAPASVLQGAVESDTQINFFSESAKALPSVVNADITEIGSYSSAAALTPGTIPSGTQVNSYYIHADPIGISQNVSRLLAGEITFPTNILGVIVTDANLNASDAVAGSASTVYPTSGRGLRLNSPTDTVILSSDERTVTLHLSVSSATDDVRVITAANTAAGLGPVTSATFNIAAAPGSISTVAGSTWVFPGVAGLATSVPLGLGADYIGATMGIATDASGNVYFADPNNNMIFKLSGTALSIVAGTGVEGYSGDGATATNARLDLPSDVAFGPAGALYVADSNNNVIRKIDSAGNITTVAGNGISAEAGDGGPATSASLDLPGAIAFDAAGNLFIADVQTIREVNTSGVISTVSFTSVPAGLTVACPGVLRMGPGGFLYVPDVCLNQVFKFNSGGSLSVVAGTGNPGYTGDGGQAISASFDYPSAIAFDASGNLFITDQGNSVVRKVDASGTITTVAGQSTAAGFTGDGGPALLATLTQPGGLAFDSAGNMFISDTTNERIRKVDTSGTITTVAGNGRFKYAGDGGSALSASLDSPPGVAVDPAGDLFISDVGNLVLRKVGLNGQISTYAGTGVFPPAYTGDGGPATSATLGFTIDVQADSAGNVYFTEGGRVHKVTPSGIITTLASNGTSNPPQSILNIFGQGTGGGIDLDAHLALDNQGDVYISGGSRVFKLDTSGALTALAGTGKAGFSGDGGLATSAQLGAVTRGLAVDNAGDLFIADQSNNRVRKVNTSGIITTVAGDGSTTSSGDGGPATSAGLPAPWGLVVDEAGNLYVSDASRIRKVDASGTITTIAGGGFIGSTVDGVPALNATFNFAQGLAFDAAGNLYVNDRFDDRIRKITGVTTAPPSIFNPPSGLAVETKGLPHGMVATAYFQTLSVVGGASPYTWSVSSGSLPAGLSLSSTGAISGTPTTAGPSTFVVKVTDSSGATATQSITITIIGQLVFPPQTLNNAVTGLPYTFALVANGGTTPYTFTLASGTLPTGLTLASTGAITGTTNTLGTFTFASRVTDSSTSVQTATQTFTLVVVPQLVITTASLPNGTVGLAYNASVLSTGGSGTITEAVTAGTLPTGLTVSAAGLLSGTPTVANTFTFTVTATDQSVPPQTASQAYSVVISGGAGVPAQIFFAGPPQNSIASQPMETAIEVEVLDVNDVPVSGATVTLTFNGTPACPNATINGGSSVSAVTGASGIAVFSGASNLSIDRGHTNYTLTATAGTVSANSSAFNVEGFCSTATPSSTRYGATATLLTNGKVLLAGGQDATAGVVTTAELYDPVAKTFTATGNMNVARLYATATLLNDGTVLIAGGTSTALTTPLSLPATALSSAEIYNPATGQFTLLTAQMSSARVAHTATLLNDGTVLIAGGSIGGGSGTKLDTAEIYDPTAQTFTLLVATMNDHRESFTATLLPSGKVLLAGGLGSQGQSSTTADIYDPAAKMFTATSPMIFPHAVHQAALLPSGLVAIIGGIVQASPGLPENAIELFNSATNTFQLSTAELSPTARFFHSATTLLDGRVLVDGGFDVNRNAQSSGETFGVSQVDTPTSDMQSARSASTATLLQDQSVLFAGGTFTGPLGGQTLATMPAEIFYPATVLPFSINSLEAVEFVNVPFSTVLQAVGGNGKLTWQITSGTLPSGLTLTSAGLLSGTVTTVGQTALTLQVTDSSNPPRTATGTFFVVIDAPQLFIDPILPDANPSVAYSQPIFVNGGTAPYTFSLVSGALPSGLTLASNGTVSGTTSTTGTFSFVVQVTDSSMPAITAQQTVNVSVAAPLTITTASLPNGIVGTPYSATITASGGIAPLTFFAGSLPPGLTLSSAGVLSGTPTTSGVFPTLVEVEDSSASPEGAVQNYTISITGTPVASLRFVNTASQFFLSDSITASVLALDASNNPIANTTITLVVSTNPCSTTASVTFTATTDATGTATFNVDVSGAGFGYALTATSFNNVMAISNAFNVAGSCTGAQPNSGHYAGSTTVLNNGQVLVAGGQNSTSGVPVVATAELYDPVAAKFTLIGNLTVARAFHTATLLANGNVLIVGGLSQVVPASLPLASVEVYNPATGVFTAFGSLSVARFNHTATLLSDGTVLIAGGNNGSGAVSSAEIINPTAGTITLLTNSMNASREMATATLLSNGAVLIAGGLDMPRTVPPGLATAEIYNPVGQTFTLTGSMNSGHAGHTATLLVTGKVLIAGGENIVVSSTTSNLSVAELYDPASGTFSLTGNMLTGRALHTATVLPDNKVLMAGGETSFDSVSSALFEIYDPSAGTFSSTGLPLFVRILHGAALLNNGTVLLVGGGSLFAIEPAEIYYPPVYPVVFLTTALPNGTLGSAYSSTILTTGGYAPVTFQVTSGTLPLGLTLTAQGVLGGTPTSGGTFTFTVAATDSSTVAKDSFAPQSTAQSYTVTIN